MEALRLIKHSVATILACPRCRGSVSIGEDQVVCNRCGQGYPVINGTPIMLLEPVEITADEMPVRNGYSPWIHYHTMASLPADAIVVDCGAGNQRLDCPNLVRLDVTWSPYVDVVGDALHLPFRDESVDFIFSLSVLEHLPNPFTTVSEMYRVCRPGGYVYAETNFVYTYHGYPHHYFNSSLQGIEELFCSFRKLHSGVAPYQMPSFALENLLIAYLHHFKISSWRDTRLIWLMLQLLQQPLRDYDDHVSPKEAHLLAAGVFFYGIRQEGTNETILPQRVLRAYWSDPALQDRFPNPYDLSSVPNLMTWARENGLIEDKGAVPVETIMPLEASLLESEEPDTSSISNIKRLKKAWRIWRHDGFWALMQEICNYQLWTILSARFGDNP